MNDMGFYMYKYLKQQMLGAAKAPILDHHDNDNHDDLDIYVYLREDAPISTYFDIRSNPMVNFVDDQAEHFTSTYCGSYYRLNIEIKAPALISFKDDLERNLKGFIGLELTENCDEPDRIQYDRHCTPQLKAILR